MKTTFVATVFNEEENIKSFLDSLMSQTVMPDETIIVDAGSRDKTTDLIRHYGNRIKLFVIKGNRSLGRNYGIRKASGDIILVSDAGCILDKEWVKNIIPAFDDSSVSVVSGYYYPVTENVFQKSLATYTCVMPDRVNPETYLPSSRSIAFKKSAWEVVGGYPEYLDTCEDLVFARTLKKKGFHFTFIKKAFVLWRQQENIVQAMRQFYKYAIGDGMAHYFRPQTPLLFARYTLGIALFAYAVTTNNFTLYLLLASLLLCYIFWSIAKNFRYVNDWRGFFYLPLLQFTSDVAVIAGTIYGLMQGRKIA